MNDGWDATCDYLNILGGARGGAKFDGTTKLALGASILTVPPWIAWVTKQDKD